MTVQPFYKQAEATHTAYDLLFEKVGGPLTNENVRFIYDEYERLRNIVMSGDYSREYSPDTYTGFIFGDFNLFRDSFYYPIRYAVTYRETTEEIVRRATENMEIYTSVENDFEVQKNRQIASSFDSRRITEFHDYFGTVALFRYIFSTIIILLLCIVAITPVFVSEKETEMRLLLQTSKKGSRQTVRAKILAALIFGFSVCVLFSIVDLTMFSILYRNFDGWHQPLYAIEMFAFTPITWSIGAYFVFSRILLFLGIGTIITTILAVSQMFKKVLFPYIINVSIIAILYLIYTLRNNFGFSLLNLFNPLNLLLPIDMFRNFHAVNFMEISVPTLFLPFIGALGAISLATPVLFRNSKSKDF
jgi:hypothetical protein